VARKKAVLPPMMMMMTTMMEYLLNEYYSDLLVGKVIFYGSQVRKGGDEIH
jgi:hypothetical protein